MRRMMIAWAVGSALATLAGVASAQAQSTARAAPSPGAYLAGNCANCHGTDGRSAGGGGMPGLAGLSPSYFVEQMRAFRDGSRKATVMHQLAKGYSDEQVAMLAQFFSQQAVAK